MGRAEEGLGFCVLLGFLFFGGFVLFGGGGRISRDGT